MKPRLAAFALLLGCTAPLGATPQEAKAAPDTKERLAKGKDAQEPAPFVPGGLVKIPGGSTIVGLELKAAIKRLQEERNPTNRAVMGGEVGQHTASVKDFWISPTLVTNEMYLEFVTATGARPPATWAVVPKELKDQTILENQKRNPAFKWDEDFQGQWWAKNWQDPQFAWQMQPAAALEPVVFITYEEALSYCAWAGVRLPTEEEYIRAGRGDGDQDFPFGKEFKREIVEHNTTLPAGLAFKRTPVAMFPNASQYGVYDLVGNVWEWTSSRYMPYQEFPTAGFKIKVKESVTDERGKTKVVEKEETVMPGWDPSRRVIKGGSFAVDPNFCRLDVRMGFDPSYASQMVGFRVVSTGRPAVDASLLRARHLRSNLLGGKPEDELDGERVLGLERRSMGDLAAVSAKRAVPALPMKAPDLPESYQIFGPSEIITLIPRRDPFAGDEHPETQTIDQNTRKTREFPTLGVFVTSYPLQEPAIPAGTYILAWMPSYKADALLAMGALLPEKEMPEELPELKEEDKAAFDVTGLVINDEHEHLLFVDNEGKVIGALPLMEDLKHQQDRAAAQTLTLNLENDLLDYRMRLPGRTGKSYSLRFRLKVVDAAGKSLVRADWWQGDYEVHKAPPGSRSISAQ